IEMAKYSLLAAILGGILAAIYYVKRLIFRHSVKKNQRNSASADMLRDLGIPEEAVSTILQFRVNNGALNAENLEKLETLLANQFGDSQTAADRARKIIATLKKLNDHVSTVTTIAEIEQDADVAAVVANWKRSGLLNDEILAQSRADMAQMYPRGNELEKEQFKGRYLSVLHNRVFFDENGAFRSEALARIEQGIKDIYKKLGLGELGDDGENYQLMETIKIQIKYALYYEFLTPVQLASNYVLITSVDNLTKYPLSEEEWKKLIAANGARRNTARADALIEGSVMSLEKYVMMQVISMKIKGLNAQGRLEELIWKKISEDKRISDWLDDDIQAKMVIPYIKAYYQTMYLILREHLQGKFGLENIRDKRGTENGAKEGIRYQMYRILWEEYNEFFRHMLGDPQPKFKVSKEEVGKFKKLRESVEAAVNDLIDTGYLSSEPVAGQIVLAGVQNESYDTKRVRAKFGPAAQKQLERAIKEFVIAADKHIGYKTERKHRMSMAEISRLMFKYVGRAIVKGESSKQFRLTLKNIARRSGIKAVIFATTALAAFYLYNAIPQWALMSMPALVALPFTPVAVIGLVIYIAVMVIGYLLRNKKVQSDPLKAQQYHRLQLIGQAIGIVIGIVGLFIGAPIFVDPVVIPPLVGTLLKIIPYLILFETVRLTPYAVHYFVKAILTRFDDRKNDVYHVNPAKSVPAGKALYSLLTDSRKTVYAAYAPELTRGQERIAGLKVLLNDLHGDDDTSYDATMSDEQYKKLNDLLERINDKNAEQFADEFTSIIPDDLGFFQAVFKTALTTNHLIKIRIIRWINDEYRLDRPGAPLTQRFLATQSISINAAKETIYLTRKELNAANKEDDEITTRLGMLAMDKPEIWNGLVKKVGDRLIAQGVSSDIIKNDLKQLRALPEHPDRKLDLSEAAWQIVELWANYNLPTGWVNVLTLTKVRDEYARRLEIMGLSKAEAQAQSKEMVRIMYRLSFGLKTIEDRTVQQVNAGWLKSNLRRYFYLREFERNTRSSYMPIEEYVAKAGYTPNSPEGVILKLAAEKDIFLVWHRTDELVHGAKYSQFTPLTPFLIGQVTLFLDADHQHRYENIRFMPEAALTYWYDTRLGASIPVVDHYLAENLGTVGKAMPVGENGFYYHAMHGKELMGGLGAYGKFYVRTQALRWSEGLTDDYVAEDIETAFNLMLFGYTIGRFGYIRLGKNWAYQWIDSTDPLFKWSSDAAEAATGRIAVRLLASPEVSWSYKVDNFWFDGFGFYFKKPYIARYVKWLVAIFLILNLNLFIGIALFFWLTAIVLSQSISYGLVFNNVYDKGLGWIKGSLRSVWQIISTMYWFFVHQIFTYDDSVRIVGSQLLSKFITTKGKGGAIKRIPDYQFLYLKSAHAVRTGVLWSAITFTLLGFNPYTLLLWAVVISMFVASWIAPFVFNGTTTKEHQRENMKDISKAGFWGILDNIHMFNMKFPGIGKLERDLTAKESKALYTIGSKMKAEMAADFKDKREYLVMLNWYNYYYSHMRRLYNGPSIVLLQVVADLIESNAVENFEKYKAAYSKAVEAMAKDLKNGTLTLNPTEKIAEPVRLSMLERIADGKRYLAKLLNSKLIDSKEYDSYMANLNTWEAQLGRITPTKEALSVLVKAKIITEAQKDRILELGLSLNDQAIRNAVLDFMAKQQVITEQEHLAVQSGNESVTEAQANYTLSLVDLRTLLDFLNMVGKITDTEYRSFILALGSPYAQSGSGWEKDIKTKVAEKLAYKKVETIDWYVTEYEYLPLSVDRYPSAYSRFKAWFGDHMIFGDVIGPEGLVVIIGLVAVGFFMPELFAPVFNLAGVAAGFISGLWAAFEGVFAALLTLPGAGYVAAAIGIGGIALLAAPVVILAAGVFLKMVWTMGRVVRNSPAALHDSFNKKCTEMVENKEIARYVNDAVQVKEEKKVTEEDKVQQELHPYHLKDLDRAQEEVAASSHMAGLAAFLRQGYFVGLTDKIVVFGGAARDWLLNSDKDENDRLSETGDLDILLKVSISPEEDRAIAAEVYEEIFDDTLRFDYEQNLPGYLAHMPRGYGIAAGQGHVNIQDPEKRKKFMEKLERAKKQAGLSFNGETFNAGKYKIEDSGASFLVDNFDTLFYFLYWTKRKAIAMRAAEELKDRIAAGLGQAGEEFRGSLYVINGRRISIVGAIDDHGHIYIDDNFASMFRPAIGALTVDRIGVDLETGKEFAEDKKAWEDLQKKELTFVNSTDFTMLTFDKVMRVLRFVAQYPGAYINAQDYEEIKAFFGEMNSYEPTHEAIKEWQAKRRQLQSGSAASASASTQTTSGTGAAVQGAEQGAGTSGPAVQGTEQAAGTSGPAVQADQAAGTSGPSVQAEQGAGASGPAVQSTGSGPQVQVTVSTKIAADPSVKDVSAQLGAAFKISDYAEDIFKHTQDKAALKHLLEDTGAAAFFAANGVDINALADKTFVKSSNTKWNDDKRQNSARIVTYYESYGADLGLAKTLEEKEAALIKYLTTDRTFANDADEALWEESLKAILDQILAKGGQEVFGQRFQEEENRLMAWEVLHRNMQTFKQIIGPDDRVNAKVTVRIIENIMREFGFDPAKMMAQQGIEEDTREVLAEDADIGAARNVPFAAANKKRLSIQNPDPAGKEKAAKSAVRRILAAGSKDVVYVLIDMDNLSQYHEDFGPELKYAGKVRSIIEEAIKANQGHLRIRHYAAGGDKSIIVIEGSALQYKDIEDVIKGINQDVVTQSTDRLAVAELDIDSSNADMFGIIERVTGQKPIEWRNRYFIWVDILENETPARALARTLNDFNTVVLRDHNFSLRARLVKVVGPFSVSMGAVYAPAGTAETAFYEIAKEAYAQLDQAKHTATKRTVRLVSYAQGLFSKAASYTAELPQAKNTSDRSQWELIEGNKLDAIKTSLVHGPAAEEAVIVLKGPMPLALYQAILNKLSVYFDINIGVRSALNDEEILAVWGPTGIRARAQKISDALGTEGDQLLAAIDAQDTAAFVQTLEGIQSNNTHVNILRWLWNYMHQPVTPIRLTLKETISKQDVLNDFGFGDVEAAMGIAADEMALQDVVDLAVGEAHTRNQPLSLRYLVGTELQSGALYDFVTESRAAGVPYTAIYAGANGIHSPSAAEYAGREQSVWAGKLNAGVSYQTVNKVENIAKAKEAGDEEKLKENTLAQEAIADESDLAAAKSAEQIIARLENKAGQLSQGIFGKELEMLNKRLDYFKFIIRQAYTLKGKYGFYHALVAVSNFLIHVSGQIKAKTDSKTLKIYLARDGINFWIAGYISEPVQLRLQYLKHNIIFHLSRAHIGYIYEKMKIIVDATDAEVKETGSDYWMVFMRNFRAAMFTDAEFNALVAEVSGRLRQDLFDGFDSVMIVESLAEGILTGFLKAVIMIKTGKQASEVKEFIVAPKREMNIGRNVERYEFASIDESAIAGWFAKEGLDAPEVIDVNAFEVVKEKDIEADDTRIERRTLEAQVYPMDYPLSEVNLGHPIEFVNGNIVRSEAAKQLGFYFRQLLLVNATSSAAREDAPVQAASVEYALSQDILPQENRLTGKQKELFDFLVHKHNEIFTTVSDSKQVELLTRLSQWISIVSALSAEQFETIADALIVEESVAEYKWQFERFLFEFRQFETQADFFNTMTWLMNYYSLQDMTAKKQNKDSYILSDITNELRRAREVIGKIKRQVVGRARISIAYGEEEVKKDANGAARADDKDFIDQVKEYDSKQQKVYVVIVPEFTSKDGKQVYVYQQGVQARFGGSQSEKFLKEWQAEIEAMFEKNKWAIRGKRSSNMMAIAPDAQVISYNQDKEEIEIQQSIQEALDQVTLNFEQSHAQENISVRSIMTVFALPADNQLLNQAYQSLHNLRFLEKETARTLRNSRIFYTTAGEIIDSVNTHQQATWELKLKAENMKEAVVPADLKQDASMQGARAKTLASIARNMGRSRDTDTKPLVVYLTYLVWAHKQGLGRLAIRPQEVLELNSLSAADIELLKNAVVQYGFYDEVTAAYIETVLAARSELSNDPFPATRTVNIVGPSRSGKTTLAQKLSAELIARGQSVSMVDLDRVVKAYAAFMVEQERLYGANIFASEENILFYLRQANVYVAQGNVYLSGAFVSDKALHSEAVENMLYRLISGMDKNGSASTNEQVRLFLGAAQQAAARSVVKADWTVITSSNFVAPEAFNVFVSESMEKRIAYAQAAGDTRYEVALKVALQRNDRVTRANVVLQNNSGRFIVLANGDIVSLVNSLEAEDAAVRTLRVKALKLATEKEFVVVTGGKRGGLDTDMEKILNLEINFNRDGGNPVFETGLSLEAILKFWKTDLTRMVSQLHKDHISDATIAEGLVYLESVDSTQFIRWLRALPAKSKKAQLIRFSLVYWMGNIKLVEIESSKPLDKAELQESLQAVVIRELRLTDKPLNDQLIWEQWNNVLKFDSDTGKLGFVTAEAKKMGLSLEDIRDIATGVQVLSGREDAIRLISVLGKEELEALVGARSYNDEFARTEQRTEEVPLDEVGAVNELFNEVVAQVNQADALTYSELKDQVFNGAVNPAAALEAYIRSGKLFALIPELKELLYVASSGTLHNSHSMLEHTLSSIRSLVYVEEAANLLADMIGDKTLAQTIAAVQEIILAKKSDAAAFEQKQALEYYFKQYKEEAPYFSKITMEDFTGIVWAYTKAGQMSLSTPDRANDAKVLLFLAIVLHDIGKTVAIRQHLMLGTEMSEKIFERAGFNAADIQLGKLLVEQHSLTTRISAGYESFGRLNAEISEVVTVQDRKEEILNAILVLNFADMGGIPDQGILAAAQAKEDVATMGRTQFVEDKGEDVEAQAIAKIAIQAGWKPAAAITDAKARDELNTFAQLFHKDVRTELSSIIADKNKTLVEIKDGIRAQINELLSQNIPSEMTSHLPLRVQQLSQLAAEQQVLTGDDLASFYSYCLLILAGIENDQDLLVLLDSIPEPIKTKALGKMNSAEFFESRKEKLKVLLENEKKNILRGFGVGVHVEVSSIVRPYLVYKLAGLSETPSKIKRLQDIIAEIRTVDQNDGFLAFVAKSQFYYTGHLLSPMSADSVMNFLYMAYRYSLEQNAIEPAVYLASELEIADDGTAKILDEKLRMHSLWKNAAISAEDFAADTTLQLSYVKARNQIIIGLPMFGDRSIAEKKIKSDEELFGIRDSALDMLTPRQILKNSGIDVAADANVEVISVKKTPLNVQFARVFSDSFTGKVLSGEITINVDNQYIWLHTTGEIYVLEGNVITGKVHSYNVPVDLINKLYYSDETTAAEIILKELSLMHPNRFSKIAMAVIFLPWQRVALKKLEFFDQERVNNQIKLVEPAIKQYVSTLNAGLLIPVSTKRSPRHYPATTGAVVSNDPTAKSFPAVIEKTIKVVFEPRQGRSLAEYDDFTHTLKVSDSLQSRAPPALIWHMDLYFSLVAQGYSDDDANKELRKQLIIDQSKLKALISTLDPAEKGSIAAAETTFLNNLKYLVAEYPAKFKKPENNTFNKYDRAAAKTKLDPYFKTAIKDGIAVTYSDTALPTMAQYRFYPKKEIIVDFRLADILPLKDQSQDTSIASQVLVDDIIAHLALFDESKDKWEVWAARAEYYRDNMEEFLMLNDMLTAGAYEIVAGISNNLLSVPNYGNKGPSARDGDDLCYLTMVRINVPLRTLRKEIEDDTNADSHKIGRHYFSRFSQFKPGSPNWPGRFKSDIETNWLLTNKEVLDAKKFFIDSAANIEQVDSALKLVGARIKVAVVVGMHKEKGRLSPPSDEFPLGEDSARKKIEQMEELFANTNIDWELIFVAHVKSPDNSGKVVEDILQIYYPEYLRSGKVRSVYMTGPGVGKGGKVYFGMKEALKDTPDHSPSDIVIYTDADVTVDLRESGLLLKPMILDDSGEIRFSGSYRFRVDDINIEFMRAALKPENICNSIVLEKLRQPSDKLDQVTAQGVTIALNKILTMKNLYSLVKDITNESSLCDEIRVLHRAAEDHNKLLKGQDYGRLNRALLESIYSQAIKKGRLNEKLQFNGVVAAYGSRVPVPGIKGFAMPGLDPSPASEENIINQATKAVNTKYFFAPLTVKGYKETQCGFKAYPKPVLDKILDDVKDTTFSFDTELMTLT
ncbi:MAG: hypothetical protein WC547_00575, partial [Candidatus Omnitrophota bacterium]